jgi:hypothetical protein
MSAAVWTFPASGLLHRSGFRYGFAPDPVVTTIARRVDSGIEGAQPVVAAWPKNVLAPLLTSTLVPALPFPVETCDWTPQEGGNPVRARTVNGLVIGEKSATAFARLHPYSLTVPVAFLADAALGNVSPNILAGIPLDIIAAASTAGLNATETRDQWRAGSLTSESLTGLAALAALQA